MPEGAYGYPPGSGAVQDMGLFRMTVKASAASTGAALTVLEADEPADFGPPMHVHEDAAEAFYVLAGEYVVFIGSSERRCPVGSFIWVPPGVEHGFRAGAAPSHKLNLYVPSAMEGYYEELAAAAAGGTPPTDDDLTAMAARNSCGSRGGCPTGTSDDTERAVAPRRDLSSGAGCVS